MKIKIKKFSDITYAVNEIRYWIDNGDYDKIYSNRGYVLEQARSLMEPMYIHLWMIMYPLEGQEYTRAKNISDLAKWIAQIIQGIKNKLSLLTVYVELESGYLHYVKSELIKHHGYSDLSKILGKEISERMADIFAKLNVEISDNTRKCKHYQITKERIEEIIQEVLELDI